MAIWVVGHTYLLDSYGLLEVGDPCSGCWWASTSLFWPFLTGPKTAKTRFMTDDHTKTLRVGGELIRWVWAAPYWGSICPISQFIGYNCPFSYLEVEVIFATCPIRQKTIRFEISMDLLSTNGRTVHSLGVAEAYWSISIVWIAEFSWMDPDRCS